MTTTGSAPPQRGAPAAWRSSKLAFGSRILLGLLLVSGGINNFLGRNPVPDPTPEGDWFLAVLQQTGYLLETLAITEIAVGGALLSGYFVPLALVVFAPVLVNIFLFHVFLQLAGWEAALAAAIFYLHLVYLHRRHFASVLSMKAVALALTALLVSAAPSPAAAGGVGGVDHVGLTVTKLEASEAFFTELLGFSVLRRDDDYPAVFLTNDRVIVTLWRASDPGRATPFDRKRNVGLHHLAFEVASFEALDALHGRLAREPGVRIEFAPEPLSGGPTRHMMIREPSGNRLEFIHRPATASP